MQLKKLFPPVAAALIMAVPAVLFAGQRTFPRRGHTYKVTITNLTGGVVMNPGAPGGQIMSPPVVATHNAWLTPLFVLGSPASSQLATVAEEGDTGPLMSLWSSDPNVKDVEAGTEKIFPGKSVTIMVNSELGFNRISLAGMLVTTNDGFYALHGMALPRWGSVTYYSPGYDAGSEVDSELCEFIPGPPCGSHNVRDTSGAPGYVFVHSGIHGQGDLAPQQFDWRNPVAKITITVM